MIEGIAALRSRWQHLGNPRSRWQKPGEGTAALHSRWQHRKRHGWWNVQVPLDFGALIRIIRIQLNIQLNATIRRLYVVACLLWSAGKGGGEQIAKPVINQWPAFLYALDVHRRSSVRIFLSRRNSEKCIITGITRRMLRENKHGGFRAVVFIFTIKAFL